ncbi:MAG TPA: hypothetical protein PLF13_11725 [candidate division Zixibacteria bacterium]|nr:hypothetical protein [candidate division Zixibacteria bacterium]
MLSNRFVVIAAMLLVMVMAGGAFALIDTPQAKDNTTCINGCNPCQCPSCDNGCAGGCNYNQCPSCNTNMTAPFTQCANTAKDCCGR